MWSYLESVQASRSLSDAILVSARMNDPADLCLHELFEEQVRRTPALPALEGANISLTYSELDRLADRLAAYLRSLGIGPDDPVGVYMQRRGACQGAFPPPPKGGGAPPIPQP